MSKSGMIVAGVMSGTSADGIDVALVQIAESKPHARVARAHTITLLGHMQFPYPTKVRASILGAMNAATTSVADLARLNVLLGELYADAVLATQRRFRAKADLVGCHGQTLYHQGEAQSFLGRKVATTWQTGEGAMIAARVGVPVVSDFRPADMAAGGKGAPLVPFLDFMWFRDARVGRIVQNIGGIANLTAIPARACSEDVVAFDTGPGNMVIDALTQQLFGKAFDRDGEIAASGELIEPVLQRILRGAFFRAKPPKTAGREEFGREFVAEFRRSCRGARKQDMVATATALTARSIAEAVRRFVTTGNSKVKDPTPSTSLRAGLSHKSRQGWGTLKSAAFREIILSGGGARNATLVGMLAELLAPVGIVVRFSDEFGLPSEAKEAVAFAVLAYETWNRRASNVPSATGAKRAAVLGKISYA
jgi:anhydro-N-acetylmuramic acid kinase